MLEPDAFSEPKTRRAVELLESWGSAAADARDPRRRGRPRRGLSFRNLAGVAVRHHEDVGVADVLGAASLLVSRPALDALSARAAKPRRGGAEEAKLMEPSQVIIRPVISEKSYVLSAAGKYTFRVHPDAT